MNSNVSGSGAAAEDDDEVKKKALQFSPIYSDF